MKPQVAAVVAAAVVAAVVAAAVAAARYEAADWAEGAKKMQAWNNVRLRLHHDITELPA